jgi:hypothetical protein
MKDIQQPRSEKISLGSRKKQAFDVDEMESQMLVLNVN